MVSEQEYAQLSSRAYAATQKNRTPKTGCSEAWIPDGSLSGLGILNSKPLAL